MITTHYRQLHGELEGKVSVFYEDEEIHGTLYATDFGKLYRATRFLTLRHLDKHGFSSILADTHGEDEQKEVT
jgi:hypothetical protein